MYISNVKNIHMTTSTKSNRIMQTVSGFILAVSLLGAGCNNAQLPTPTPTTTLSTPEDAWKLYQEGWRKAELTTVLSACASTDKAQDRCRRQFLAVQAKGGVQTLSSVLERGVLSFDTELDGIRYYIFAADGKGTPVMFSFTPENGWKLEEF